MAYCLVVAFNERPTLSPDCRLLGPYDGPSSLDV
jgi:hypothetical protein